MNVRKFALKLAMAAAVIAPVQAQAATFVLNSLNAGTAQGTQARRGFEIAAGYWSSVLRDDVTVNLNIGFSALAPGVLGSAGSARSLLSMSQGYSALSADRTSTLDMRAVASLPELGVSAIDPSFGAVAAVANAINATNNGYVDTRQRIDADGGVNNSTLAVNKAAVKALGVTTDVNGNAVNYATADGSINFSSSFSFDFDPSDGISSTSFDFIGVAVHEIGHVLGFTSGVDTYDAFTAPNGPNLTAGLLEDFVVMNTLDLYRYSAPGALDWSTSAADKYFSIDSGTTQLFGESRLALGRFNGDGDQASHWLDSAAGEPQLGILDPTSGRGQMQDVTALDLSAYDAIGWNLSFDTLANSAYRVTTRDIYLSAVPEPATWAMLLFGFGAVGAGMRRKRRDLAAA